MRRIIGGCSGKYTKEFGNNWGEPERSPTLLSSMHSNGIYIYIYIIYYASDVNRHAFHEDIRKVRDSESTACSNKSLY